MYAIRSYYEDILAIGVLGHLLAQGLQHGEVDPAHAVGDLLQTGHDHVLALLDDLHEARGLVSYNFV